MPSKGRKYPFQQMKVGDSFFIETKGIDEAYKAAASAVSMFKKRNQPRWRFAVRRVPGGVRVWRTDNSKT